MAYHRRSGARGRAAPGMRRPGRIALAAVLAAAALLLGACSGDGDGAPSSAGGTGDAPAADRFTGTDGAQLYAQACARCHGETLTGTNQGPPFLDRVYEPGHHADAAFLLAVRNGARAHHWDFGDMPPVPGLNDAQVTAIVAFVRAQQRAAGID